jgi:hypothetical protein
MFPDSTDPCNWGTWGTPPNGPVTWKESAPNQVPGGRKGVGISGPFTMEATAYNIIDAAVVFAEGRGSKDSTIAGLFNQVRKIKNKFYHDSVHTNCQTTSIDEYSAPASFKIKIFPNPVSGNRVFEIEIPENTTAVELIITDIEGRLVYKDSGETRDNYKIDAGDIGSGLYFCRLRLSDQVLTGKVLILAN